MDSAGNLAIFTSPGRHPSSVGLLLSVAAVLLAGCGGVREQSATQPSGSQTQQTNQLEPTAAEIGQPELTPPQATEVPAGPPTPTPSFEGVALPEEFGELIEENGQWTFNGQPVVLAHHTNADGDVELWLSLATSPAWPLFIQRQDGAWVLGVEEWMGEITIVNTNEAPLQVSLAEFDGVQGEDLGSLGLELAPFEISSFPSMPPGSYQVTFSFDVVGIIELSCTIELSNDSQYEFIAVPEGIAVLEENFIPQTASDIDVRTSPLCGF